MSRHNHTSEGSEKLMGIVCRLAKTRIARKEQNGAHQEESNNDAEKHPGRKTIIPLKPHTLLLPAGTSCLDDAAKDCLNPRLRLKSTAPTERIRIGRRRKKRKPIWEKTPCNTTATTSSTTSNICAAAWPSSFKANNNRKAGGNGKNHLFVTTRRSHAATTQLLPPVQSSMKRFDGALAA